MTQRNFTYPQARRADVVEDYHGTPVADPYRWMEDPDAPETVAWAEAQSALTFDYLGKIPARQTLQQRLTALWNYPKIGLPIKRGNTYFYQKNDGLQDQPVLYKQTGLDGAPEVLIDPNTLSADGTVALMLLSFSKDGALLAYSVSDGGSDWQQIRIRDVATGEDMPETLRWTKFSGIAWKHDGSGFFYNRYPEMDDLNQPPYNSRVCWHKVGTPQDDDILIYEQPEDKELGFEPILTDDGAYLVLYVWHGAINRNRIYYRPAESDGDFVRLLNDADAEYAFTGSDGATFFFQTDLDAPKGRVIAIDLNNPAREHWKTVIPESDDVIQAAQIINHQFVVVYMHNAYSQVKRFALDGTWLADIALPGIGSVIGISGKPQDTQCFIDFQSYLDAPTLFRYEFTDSNADGTLTPWQQFNVDFPVADYETTQVFYPSKDGTQVSMFITHKKGIALDGTHPTLLYGYGGYSISLTPTFQPQVLGWLELGGVFAVANLRGGSEYGEAWHQAGMLGNKQNVFDDFIAAGEWLIQNGYTQPKKLAINGRSNGGLLVAACMTQRPDLFGAVICAVPVTDMLRYHKFSAGRFWTPEYGDAETNAAHFTFMMRYSPLHNVRDGETYPPTLILTADHDDRVVPMHAEKFTATLQHADSGQNPILLRLDMRSGHGMGKSTSKWIQEWADVFAFLAQHLVIR